MKDHKENRISRRSFIGGIAAAAITMGTSVSSGQERVKPAGKRQFKLKYAPNLGTFQNHAGKEAIDNLNFIADQGFTAVEDNAMLSRHPSEPEKIAKEMERLGMTMGVFVAYAEFSKQTFVTSDKSTRQMLTDAMKTAVETAKKGNVKWTTVVLGAYNPRMDWDYQTVNVIENLKWCAEVYEPAGVVMVLEPLNPRDHPGLFLTKISQAYQICKAVNSPSCKILDDLYHQQVTEGNLIPNIDSAWEQIAYFQVGDNPGRCEPTTGEINYKNIFKHLYNKGYKGILGMEHGKSKPGKEGETALIDAYAACDDF